MDKYSRSKGSKGSRKAPVKTKDIKLRANLKRIHEKFEDAAQEAYGTEHLLLESSGFLEPENEMEQTFKVRQDEIVESVDVSSAQKKFDLSLDTHGPYVHDYSRSGNSLLLGGRKGHIASMDWKTGQLNTEIYVDETVHAVKWLQSDNQFFAAAQKKYTFIYDHQGAEVHRLKKHIEATSLEYLPYHFLLVTAGNTGFIKYQDVSTGQLVSELRTKLGATTTIAQNPYNAVIHAGHTNGTITLWTPSMPEPAVKVLSARGPVRAISVNRDGRYMVAAGADKSVKIWDLRTYKELESYYSPTPASSVSISDTGLVAVGWGPHVQVWKDILNTGKEMRQHAPYMNHLIPSSQVVSTRFCPFEDVLGLGHSKGFSSIIVPGSGEANFDSLEANPYAHATKKGRRETEVRQLLNKLQPDMIALDPNEIGNVDRRAPEQRQTAADIYEQKYAKPQANPEQTAIRPTTKSKNSKLRKYLRKKTANVIDDRKLRIEANLKREKLMRQNKLRAAKGLAPLDKGFGAALDRFKS